MPVFDLKSRRNRRILAVAALAVPAGIALYAWIAHGKESTDDAQIDAHVAPIASEVSGYVIRLDITDNEPVKKGQVLLQIDPTDYRNALAHAEGELQQATARLSAGGRTLSTTRVSAPSNLASAEAELAAAKAQEEKTAADLARLQSVDPQARSAVQLDAAAAAEKAAEAQVRDARAKVKTAATAPETVAVAEANMQQAQAAVAQAQADVDEAEKKLADTTLTAPFAGHVAERGVEVGSYVQPGVQLLSVVSDDYWVVANFKETQITRMRPGQKASIRIDAYPKKNYRGHVDSIQTGTGARFSAFPPENATGNFVKIVQRVPVKILFDQRPDPSLPIGPGMSVEPEVDVR